MRRGTARSFGRKACLSLCILLAFLSYRPAISILSIAGVAKNPTDSRHAGGTPQVDARENMPRPAKTQQHEARDRVVQKAQKSRTASDDEKILLNVLQLGPGYEGTLSTRSEKIDETTKPEYLRMFLPAIPGSPHSPPA